MSQGPDPAAGRAVEREDVEALLEVRRELGPSYDAALVDSFAERIERAVAERVDARVAEERAVREEQSRASGNQLTIAIVSVCTGVPITAIAAAIAHVPGLAIAWAASPRSTSPTRCAAEVAADGPLPVASSLAACSSGSGCWSCSPSS